MKRSGPLKRTTRLKPMSDKRRASRPERRAVTAGVFARDRSCQAATLVPDVQCAGPLDPHEIIPRSAWPSGEMVAENVVTICRAHHRWVDANPSAAHRVGLHGYSWERPA